MAKPITIPNTFANATTAIPLSQLDTNYSTIVSNFNDAATYSNYAADGGSANTYAITLSGLTTTYLAGTRFQFLASNANTGASTLNVNAQGAKNIFLNGAALTANTIAAGAVVDVVYDGTQFQMISNSANVTSASALLTSDNSWSNTNRFSGNTSNVAIVLTNANERTTIDSSGTASNITYDLANQSVLFYTGNSTAVWNVLFRFSSGTTVNTAIASNTSITAALLSTQGNTAYYNANVFIDGTQVTPRWQGGTAPTSGNANSVDAYTYTIFKRASANFVVIASQTRFA